jgi:hypothetical protein
VARKHARAFMARALRAISHAILAKRQGDRILGGGSENPASLAVGTAYAGTDERHYSRLITARGP